MNKIDKLIADEVNEIDSPVTIWENQGHMIIHN